MTGPIKIPNRDGEDGGTDMEGYEQERANSQNAR